MPSKTWKQARMMQRAADDPEYAAARNVPVSVAKDFHAEDLVEQRFFDAEGRLLPEPEPKEAAQ